MGKPTEEDGHHQQPGDLEAGAENGGFCCCGSEAASVTNAFTFRCMFVLLLSACLFLPAVFWIPPFRSLGSGRSARVTHLAPIQASFILQKPVSFLSMHRERLEYDIFEEIGVPDTRVAVISMNPLAPSNFTYVVFGVLPDSEHASNTVKPVILSVLRSSLIELVLQQSNLSLTPSIFGRPSSFEMLKFPGGITIIPVQTAPIWQITQNLFNFTLNYSIVQINRNLDELKGQLKFGLNLMYYENVYVQMTNLKGSTIEPPVIVEASVLSDVGSRSLLPTRLKQLAQTIKGSPAKNLGLNHSVFGKVKEVVLSSYLNHSITSEPPSPSPSPSDKPNPAPPISDLSPPSSASPTPPVDSNNRSPCSYCNIVPASQVPPPHASPPRGWLHMPTAQPSGAPSPLTSSPVHEFPSHGLCFPPEPTPYASPPGNSQPPPTSGHSPLPMPSPHKAQAPGLPFKAPRASPPTPIHHSSSEPLMSPLVAAGPVSATPTSNFASHSLIKRWVLPLLLILLWKLP